MYFVSAGCSYSQVPNTDTTWPVHVQEAFNLDDDHVRHLGIGAIGNEMISKIAIYNVNDLLKTHKPEDLLVGIMWSGCDRRVLTLRESKRVYDKATKIIQPESYDEIEKDRFYRSSKRNEYRNPINLACNEFNYYTLNAHWKDELTLKYYNDFVDPLNSVMQTCEHMLRVEWFLKMHNIKYFMCAYDFDTFFYAGVHGGVCHLYDEDSPAFNINSNNHNPLEHPDVKYLYDMIDRTYWLPITDLGDWARNVSKYEYRDPDHDPHPSTEQHKDFTHRIILPFIEKMYGISPAKLP
jgi:hypothetical protein